MQSWLDCHPKQFTEKDTHDHEVPTLKPCMYVVLSCLKGSKGAHYVEMELKKLVDSMLPHHYWECCANEVEGVFHPSYRKIGLAMH